MTRHEPLALILDKAVVKGAVARFPIHYKAPKLSDGTPAESATYDERSQQIAREMFYMLSQARAVTTAKK